MSEQDLVEFLTPCYERQYQAGTARRVRVLWLRFMEDRTYRAIGEEVGVSGTRIIQIIATTLRTLRRAIVEQAGSDPAFRAQILDALPPPIADAVFGPTRS